MDADLIVEVANAVNNAYLSGMKEGQQIKRMTLEQILGYVVGKYGYERVKNQMEELQ